MSPWIAARIDDGRMSTELQTWLPAGPAWPLPRMVWLRENEPQVFARAHAIVQPKDFVLQRLTGNLLSDASSWPGLVKPNGETHLSALDALGLPDLIPAITSPTSAAGDILPHAADLLGVPTDTAVFVGWNDFNCALVGTGVQQFGDAFDIAGTSEHIGFLSQNAVTTGLVNSVPWSAGVNVDSFVNYGVSSNGGSVSAWLGSTYLPGVSRSSARNHLLEEFAEASPAGALGRHFLRYLQGERSPIWNADASGAYIGLRSTQAASSGPRAITPSGSVSIPAETSRPEWLAAG